MSDLINLLKALFIYSELRSRLLIFLYSTVYALYFKLEEKKSHFTH